MLLPATGTGEGRILFGIFMDATNYRTLLELPVPRRVRLSRAATSVRFWLWIALFVITFGGSIFGYELYKNVTDLIDHGRRAEARVVDKDSSSGKSSSTYLIYEYTIDGVPRTDRRQVSLQRYDDANMGDVEQITYLPERPSVFRYGSVDKTDLDAFATKTYIVATLVLSVFAICYVWIEYEIRRDLRVARDGPVIEAKIVEIAPKAVSHSLYYGTRLEYRLGEREKEMKIDLTPTEGGAQKVGESVILLWDPQWEKAHLPRRLKYVECPDLAGS